jgi:hypothetical protein
MNKRQSDPKFEQQKPRPMEQPLKKHGDKMDVLGGVENASNETGGAGEPQTTSLEPEKQGGIGGPGTKQGGIGPSTIVIG